MKKTGKTFISRFLTLTFLVTLNAMLPNANCQATPDLINFQGRLTGSSGSLVDDSDYPISFRVFDAETVGLCFGRRTRPLRCQAAFIM